MTFKLAFKYLLRLILLALLAISIYLVNLFFMKPFSIDHFLAKETFLEIIDSPESMTYIGIFDKYNWFTGHASKLTIPSQKQLDRDIVMSLHMTHSLKVKSKELIWHFCLHGDRLLR